MYLGFSSLCFGGGCSRAEVDFLQACGDGRCHTWPLGIKLQAAVLDSGSGPSASSKSRAGSQVSQEPLGLLELEVAALDLLSSLLWC